MNRLPRLSNNNHKFLHVISHTKNWFLYFIRPNQICIWYKFFINLRPNNKNHNNQYHNCYCYHKHQQPLKFLFHTQRILWDQNQKLRHILLFISVNKFHYSQNICEHKIYMYLRLNIQDKKESLLLQLHRFLNH